MLYEWINGVKTTMGSNAQLDTDDETAQKNASPSEVRYMNQVEEGWRADGWYQIDGADILGAGDDTDWYYFKDGKAKRAEKKDDGTSSVSYTHLDVYKRQGREDVRRRICNCNQKRKHGTG